MGERGGPLPEFTRALRALGSRRGRRGTRGAGAEEQALFFAPLVGARSRAAEAVDEGGIVAAFGPTPLAAAFRGTLEGFARERYPAYAPARRALEAELLDVAEPLFDALEALRAVPSRDAATVGGETLSVWLAEVQRLFECADRVWVLLDDVLESAATTDLAPVEPRTRRGPRRKA